MLIGQLMHLRNVEGGIFAQCKMKTFSIHFVFLAIIQFIYCNGPQGASLMVCSGVVSSHL